MRSAAERGLATGAGRVGFGADMFQAQFAAGLLERAGFVAAAIVRHNALDRGDPPELSGSLDYAVPLDAPPPVPRVGLCPPEGRLSGTAMVNPAHGASFHPMENIAPSRLMTRRV